MSNMIQMINTFNSITIGLRSVILCDIDDTLLSFKNHIGDYWNTQNKIDHTYEIWFSLIRGKVPELTHDDIHSFIDRIISNDSKLILITARNEIFRDGTLEHLKSVGIKFHDIHFLNGNLKGDFIKKNYNSSEFDIHFIDDDIRQVKDVSSKNPNINVYHFVVNEKN